MKHLDESNSRFEMDQIVAQAAALEPARSTPRLTPAQLGSLASRAMGGHSAPKPSVGGWTWSSRRWGYASLAALLGSGALVTALVLGTDAVVPTQVALRTPVLHSPVLKLLRSSPITTTHHGYADNEHGFSYDFTADPALSTATGTSTAYELVSPSDAGSVAGTIEAALGLTGPVVILGPGNLQAGPSSGPDVTVALENGVLQWQYPTWAGGASQPGVAMNQAAPLPSDSQATADAENFLRSIGQGEAQFGAPEVSRSETAVQVAFPIVANGLSTDQYTQVSYGPGATVIAAMGSITEATPSATYPTISPTSAVSLLTANDGSMQPLSALTQNGMNVNIHQAVLQLATYKLADGTSWLLPTWVLSGTASGSSVSPGTTYVGDVLAIPAQYVQSVPTTSE